MLDSIPDEMKRRPNWLLWSPDQRGGDKAIKTPRQGTGDYARTNDPKTWTTFEQARAALAFGHGKRYPKVKFAGVGFVFDGQTDVDGKILVGLDFDDCLNEAGEWLPGKEEHRQIAENSGGFVERSQSGRGVHIIGRARPFKGFNAKEASGVEAYSGGRYFAVTGEPVPGVMQGSLGNIDDAVKAAFALAGEHRNSSKQAPPETRPPSVSVAMNLGPIPDQFTYLASDASPCELTAGIGEMLLADLRQTGAAVASVRNGPLSQRDHWRDAWLFPCARLAVEYPHLEPDAEALFHEVSALAGGNTAQNEAQWRSAVRALPERIAHGKPITGIGTLFNLQDSLLNTLPSPSVGPSPAPLGQTPGGNGPAPPNPFAAFGGASASGVSPASVTYLALSAVLPPRRWLGGGTDLIAGEVTTIAAPGGVGKTSLALAMAASLAAGRDLLGDRTIREPCSVLYVNAEDDTTEMQRRLMALALRHNLDQPTLDRIAICGKDVLGGLSLTGRFAGEKIDRLDDGGFEKLGRLIADAGARIAVIDPLMMLCPGGVNDNGLMAQVMGRLKSLGGKHDAAIVVVHHLRKGADRTSIDAVSGAAAIVNHARVVLQLVTLADLGGDKHPLFEQVLPSDHWRYIKLIDGKGNNAAKGSNERWFELTSRNLGNGTGDYPQGDNVQVVLPVTAACVPASAPLMVQQTDAIRREALRLIKEATDRSEPYSPPASWSKGGRTKTPFADLAAFIQANTKRSPKDCEKLARNAATDLVRRGFIAAATQKDASRHTREKATLTQTGLQELVRLSGV